MSLPIEGILFDKDGTLFDFNATWASFAKDFVIEQAAGDPARRDALAQIMGFDLASNRFHADSLVIAHTTGEIAEALLPLFPGMTSQGLCARIDDAAAGAPQVPATDLCAFLGGLRSAGMALGVATNDSEVPARAHLRSAGVEGLFDFIAGYDSGHGGKPAPGQLLAFAAQMQIAPGACVMVGDSRHDLVAGRAAGMRTVGVLTGLASAEDLAPLADVVLASIADLPEWLLAQP